MLANLFRNLFFFISFFLVLISSGCDLFHTPVIHIKGIISNAPPHLLFISKYYLDDRQELIIDSIHINQLDQRFDVVIPFIKDSNSLIKLNIGRNALFLFLDDTTGDIDLKVNLNDLGNYTVSGPLTNTLFQTINALLRPYQDSLYILANFINGATDSLKRNKLIDQSIAIKSIQYKLMKSIVDTCSSPKVALKIMYEMDFSKFPHDLKGLATMLDAKFGYYPGVKKYVHESNNYIKIIEHEFKPGDTIPDLNLVLAGRPSAKLSQLLKANNLFIFWASYCKTCIQQVLDIRKLEAFKDTSTHRVIAFSLDVDSMAYYSLLHEFPLAWPQAYDFNGWKGSIANHFLIDSIPACIIVDQHMKVISLRYSK